MITEVPTAQYIPLSDYLTDFKGWMRWWGWGEEVCVWGGMRVSTWTYGELGKGVCGGGGGSKYVQTCQIYEYFKDEHVQYTNTSNIRNIQIYEHFNNTNT